MARQNGILKIEGTVGGMTFYKTKDGNLVREKGGVSKERILNDPAFARTRENGAEFGGAGKAGKVLRDGLRPMMLNAADNRVTSRVTKLMTQVIKLDAINDRGQRTVAQAMSGANDKAAKALFNNFNFNKEVVLGSIIFKPFTVDSGTGDISIEGLIPVNDIVYPTGATHVKFSSAIATVNFGTGETELIPTTPVNLPIDSTSTDVELTATATSGSLTGVKYVLLKIEFFQAINGKQYSLKNGSYNALAIVEVL